MKTHGNHIPRAEAGTGAIAGMGACYALGTFTDNFYKQAAILLAASAGMTAVQSIATVLFSLPFVVFSAWAGAAADRISKKTIVLAVKSLEFLSMFLGGYMLLTQNWTGILTVIFLMGTQSTFFSPAINGSIPENFTPARVPRANSLIKLASTAAILAGFAMAGFVLDIRPGSLPGLPALDLDNDAYGRAMAAGFVALVALLGLLTAFTLRRKPAASGRKDPFPWSGPIQSLRYVHECRKDKSIMLAILADAWFYGVAAVAVISIANLAAQLGYSKSMSGVMMALLMIGVAAGALKGGWFSVESWRHVILPIGAAMAVSLLLAALTPMMPGRPALEIPLSPAGERFFLTPQLVWFGTTLFLTGFFGGMYIIPLESFIQVRPQPHEKGKIIAVSNFISFLAMAVFGAAFTVIGALPPALNFIVYGTLTLLFLFAVIRPRLDELPETTLRDNALSLPGFFLRGILSLRYHVKETGLDSIAPVSPGQRPGMLILPNHPALVDPVLIYSRLAGLRPRPLADENQMQGFARGLVAKVLNVVTIPDLEQPTGRGGAAATRQGLDRIAEALRRGDNVLLYPAGRVYRSQREVIGNKSAAAWLLAEVPGARVVLARTAGLWGSSFSYASGNAPSFMPQLVRGILTVLGNLVFFIPRRTVSVEFAEPDDIPRNGDKTVLNRYLESFYAKAETPPIPVRRFFWQRHAGPVAPARSTPETGPATEQTHAGQALADVPDEVRAAVYAVLRERGGLPEDLALAEDQRLVLDLHFDSLSLMEAALEMEEKFGFPVTRPEEIVTVGDCLRLATGTLNNEESVPPAEVPEIWATPLADGDAPRATFPGTSNMLESFLRLARQNPGLPLTAERTGVRTRKALLTGVLALSRRFRTLPGNRLGIMLPSVPAALAVWLAAMHAGKEPVFLNWTGGRRNLEHCIDLAGISHVISASALMDQIIRTGTPLKELPVTWIAADTLAAGLSPVEKLLAALGAALHCSPFPFHLSSKRVPGTAAVLFTSGSETRPKGVPLSHANIMCNAGDVLSVLGIRKRDTLLAMLPPFHSFGLLVGLALPATTGIPAAYHPNPTESAHLNAMVRDFKATLFGATPTFLEGMLTKARGTSDLASVRYAFAGAEKCPDHVYAAFASICPNASLCEGYGITECSPVVAVNRPGNAVNGSIGHPLPSVEVALVHEEDDPGGDARPIGRAREGETAMLLVRGPSIFSGYLALPGEPSPDPFVRFEDKPWYRTGDLVSMDQTGRLFFKGRRKRFVKIGGEMISLPLMEEVLWQAFSPMAQGLEEGKPFIAVVALHPENVPEAVELAAFTTLDVQVRDINQALRQGGLSPLYAVRTVTRLPEIPLLGSGKTDYRALQGAV